MKRLFAALCVSMVSAAASGAQPVLRIIGTNDFHGALEPRPNTRGVLWGGAVAMASAIKRARDECAPPACYSILLDAGDEFQGQAISTLARGKPVSEIFNAIGYDAAALGNHDLDWGPDTLRLRMGEERYPVLSANLRTTDGRRVGWMSPDTIIKRGPFVVGVIGVMTVDANTAIAAKSLAGLKFIDPVPLIDSLARRLRARGANVVVLLAHAGGRCDQAPNPACHGEIFEDARRLTERVDAIVAGHLHEILDGSANGIPVVQARTAGQAIDVIDLTLNGVVSHGVRQVFVDSLPRDPVIERLVAAAIAAAGPRLNEPVATIAEDLGSRRDDDALGNLIADAMRDAGRADFAATNASGVRAPLRAGVATFGALFDVQPFGNRLMLVTATGAAMRRYFEMMVRIRESKMHVSGIRLTVDTTRAAGNRIISATLPNGRELDERAAYTIVITDFIATGGLGLAFPDPTAAIRDLSIVDLDATIAYLRRLPSPVRGPQDKRWVIRP